jgi:hypothetical protein
MNGRTDFLEYLGREEQNLLTSFAKFGDKLVLMQQLDSLWRKLLDFDKETSEEYLPLFMMSERAHFHLYFSISCLLRGHLSECFWSTRVAVEAALSAYKMSAEPGTYKEYLERHPDFLYIKSHIEKARKKDKSKYPLAPWLIEAHNTCSQYGSHIDIDSFAYRLKQQDIANSSAHLMAFHYFEFPEAEKEAEFQTQLAYFLIAFLHILEIFWDCISMMRNVKDAKGRAALRGLYQSLTKLAPTPPNEEGLASQPRP